MPSSCIWPLSVPQIQMGDYTDNLGYRFYPNALCLEVRSIGRPDLSGSSNGSIRLVVNELRATRSFFRASHELVLRGVPLRCVHVALCTEIATIFWRCTLPSYLFDLQACDPLGASVKRTVGSERLVRHLAFSSLGHCWCVAQNILRATNFHP